VIAGETMLNVIIIEDEPAAARRLEKLLKENGAAITVLAHLDSISASVAWLKKNPPPDLAFMDIELADGKSFEIFKQTQVSCPVIFTTAYNEFALQAFKVNSVDYLLKPIAPEALHAALEKFNHLKALYSSASAGNPMFDAAKLLESLATSKKVYRSRFLIALRERFVTVRVEDVAYFYSEFKITNLVTHDGKRHAIEQTLEELESELNPSEFYRANRQFIVSAKSVADIRAHFGNKLKLYVQPDYPEEVLVSKEKAGEFKAWLNT
jgi:two-component system, LytTR family, response regulator LytT